VIYQTISTQRVLGFNTSILGRLVTDWSIEELTLYITSYGNLLDGNVSQKKLIK